MTQDEIIEMAKDAGAMFDHMTWIERNLLPVFFRFAELVAEKERNECIKIFRLELDKEREACAEIAESKRHAPHFVLTSMPSQNGTAVDIANLIRARGQA